MHARRVLAEKSEQIMLQLPLQLLLGRSSYGGDSSSKDETSVSMILALQFATHLTRRFLPITRARHQASSLLDRPRRCGRLHPLFLVQVSLLYSYFTAGVGDIVKASMTHRTKGKLVLTVSKQ